MDLQRRGDPEGRAGVGRIDAAAQESVGQRLGRFDAAAAQVGDHARRGRRKQGRVDAIEKQSEAFAPDRVAPPAVGGDRRDARLDRDPHLGLGRSGERRQRLCDGALSVGYLGHEAEPSLHGMAFRQPLEPRGGSGEARNGIGKEDRRRRLDSADRRPGPRARRRSSTLFHEIGLIASASASGPASRSSPAGGTICGDGARPSRASRSRGSSRAPIRAPRSPRRRG